MDILPYCPNWGARMDGDMDALDKQIPKLPKITIHGTTDLNMTVKCSSCHRLVFDYKFCPHCGQAIKREERAYTRLWEDMCSLMDMFFREDETVEQYHPAKSEYVNNMPKCLHPWRPLEAEFPYPPTIIVDAKKGQTAEDIRRPMEEEGEKQ